MSRGTFFALLLACALSACTPMWTRIDQPELSGKDHAFRIQAPTGWVHLSGQDNSLLITRDGLQIQFIEVVLQAPEVVFIRSKKRPPETALPSDLAALVLAELRANPSLANAAVIENAPARVAEQAGFRLHLEFRNSRGARYDRLVYGAQPGGKMLLFTYQALHTYFYDRDKGDFEKLVASYRPGP